MRNWQRILGEVSRCAERPVPDCAAAGVDEPVMTGAEFGCLRELLGLSHRWLSLHWGIDEWTVAGWEDVGPVPADFASDLRAHGDRIAGYELDLIDERPVVLHAPRVDEDSPDLLPALTHRLVCARVARRVPVRVVWIGQE